MFYTFALISFAYSPFFVLRKFFSVFPFIIFYVVCLLLPKMLKSFLSRIIRALISRISLSLACETPLENECRGITIHFLRRPRVVSLDRAHRLISDSDLTNRTTDCLPSYANILSVSRFRYPNCRRT